MHLLNAKETVVIVLGASDYTRAGLATELSFQRSADLLTDYLTAPTPRGLGIEKQWIRSSFNDATPPAVQLLHLREALLNMIRVRNAAGLVTKDAVIVCVGLIFTDSAASLHLMVRDTSEKRPSQTSISFAELGRIIDTALPQHRRLVLLDCGLPAEELLQAGGPSSAAETIGNTVVSHLAPTPLPAERGLLVMSAVSDRTQLPPTSFIQTLLSVLAAGIGPEPSKFLSCADIHAEICRHQAGTNGNCKPALLQAPRMVADMARFPAFPNLFKEPETKPLAEEERSPIIEESFKLQKDAASNAQFIAEAGGRRQADKQRSRANTRKQARDLIDSINKKPATATVRKTHIHTSSWQIVPMMLIVPVCIFMLGRLHQHVAIATPAALGHAGNKDQSVTRTATFSTPSQPTPIVSYLSAVKRFFESGGLSAQPANSTFLTGASPIAAVTGQPEFVTAANNASVYRWSQAGAESETPQSVCLTSPPNTNMQDNAAENTCGAYLERVARPSNAPGSPAPQAPDPLWIYRLGAAQGELKAQLFLGTLFETGSRRVPQSVRMAKFYYTLAASQGSHEASARLKLLNAPSQANAP